jgi:hypothetical protein
MKLIAKLKEKWSELDESSEDFFNSRDSPEGCLFSLIPWLITPAIFYTVGLFLFDSHRVGFFFGIPIGLLLNFLLNKIIKFQRKLMLLLLILAVFSFFAIIVGNILYGLFKFFQWIWNNLPS